MIATIKDLKTILEDKIKENDIVVISPHKGVDADAIGSALAMTMIVKKLGKESIILINDIVLENAVNSIISDIPSSINIRNEKDVIEFIKKKKALLITVDTNKRELVPFENLKVFKDKIIIDHHDLGETSIETENAYIDTAASSASEILYKLLELFQVRINTAIDENGELLTISNYLLAGIHLDTSKFTKKVSSKTMKIVSSLMQKGADLDFVNNLFLEDFEKDKKFLDLVRTTTWKMFNIAIALNNEDPTFIYDKEDLAKAADWLMKYKTSDAAFAIGLIDPEITYISGRSKGEVDIGEVMGQLGGGGNICAGAAQIECSDVKQIKLKLDNVIRPGHHIK